MNSSNVTRTKKNDKRISSDVKVADMHMKRRVPQLYMSVDMKEGRGGHLNEFNSMLQKSLLSPKRQRFISTK